MDVLLSLSTLETMLKRRRVVSTFPFLWDAEGRRFVLDPDFEPEAMR